MENRLTLEQFEEKFEKELNPNRISSAKLAMEEFDNSFTDLYWKIKYKALEAFYTQGNEDFDLAWLAARIPEVKTKSHYRLWIKQNIEFYCKDFYLWSQDYYKERTTDELWKDYKEDLKNGTR